MTNNIVRATIPCRHPMQMALAFQTQLALEKGHTSTIQPDGTAVLRVASDGQAVRFTQEPA